MTLINPEAFDYDFNLATNGYWVEHQHPQVYKWLTRKIGQHLIKTMPEAFLPVVPVRSLLKTATPRLCVEGRPDISIRARSEFDSKDAIAGILRYYTPSLFVGDSGPNMFCNLHVSSLTAWLIEQSKNQKLDLMKVTYEVAVTKMREEEEKREAELRASQSAMADYLEALREGKSIGKNYEPVLVSINEELVFTLFYLEEEFAHEGLHQKNCVHTHYWPAFQERRSLVGGLRKRSDPLRPWISIELSVSNFSVVQAEYAGWKSAQSSVEVQKFAEVIRSKKELFKALRDTAFCIRKEEENQKEGQSRIQAQGTTLSFAVRLDQPTAENRNTGGQ